MAHSWKVMQTTDVRDVTGAVVYQTAAQIVTVTCTLKDAADAVAGGINAAVGGFLNAAGTLVAATNWTVWYPDLDPTTLSLPAGRYLMYLKATRADGDVFTVVVGVVLKG